MMSSWGATYQISVNLGGIVFSKTFWDFFTHLIKFAVMILRSFFFFLNAQTELHFSLRVVV